MADFPSCAFSVKTQWIWTVIAWGIVVWLCASPVGKSLDRLVYDGLFYLRGSLVPDSDIIIIAIDEPSFSVLAHQWPWPRSWHARLIDRLFDDGAAAVAFDVVFAEPSTEVEDQAFKAALSRHGSAVLATQMAQFEGDGYIRRMRIGPSAEWLYPGIRMGLINLPMDPDGFVREIDALGEEGILPFSAAVAAMCCKDTVLPKSGILGINFIGPPGTIPSVSYYQAYLPNHLPKGFFKDKLVFVGFNLQIDAKPEQNVSDHFPVPYTRWGYGVMAGVEIHAQSVQDFCSAGLIRKIDSRVTMAAHMLLWALFGVCFFSVSPRSGGRIWLMASTLSVCGAYLFFIFKHDYWPVVSFFLPLAAIFGSRLTFHYLTVQKEKRFIRQAFSTYVSPAIVNRLVREREALNLGGEEVNITAFFSDIAGFTTISETLSPRQLVTLLNEYLTEMTDIILKNGGTVDKFVGDAIVAFFGAPATMDDHAECACRCALEMQRRLSELREVWIKNGKPGIQMRIGLCTGSAVLGNMGSRNRMDYTMMGDTPNTASRLEGANKVYGTSILASASTAHAAGDKILFREIDKVLLKGKETPVSIFEPFADPRTVSNINTELSVAFEQGLEAYRQGNWDVAMAAFDLALRINPNDGPSRVFKERCERYRISSPASWLGVHVLTEK